MLQKYSRASPLTRGASEAGMSWPVTRLQDAHVLAVVQRLLREQRPLHEVREVGADVVEALALLVAVEEPGRADVGRARHHLHQVVDALHVDARLRLRALDELAEGGSVVDELPLQLARHLVPLGHDVEGDQLLLVGGGQRLLQLGKVGRLQDPGLVHERVEAGVEGGLHAVDLAAVAPGEHDRVAGPLAEHARHEVRRGVHLHLPARGVVRALVEARHPRQVIDEVGPERRVDVHGRRDPRVHLLLDERGVEVPGVEGDEADLLHLWAPFRPRTRPDAVMVAPF